MHRHTQTWKFICAKILKRDKDLSKMTAKGAKIRAAVALR